MRLLAILALVALLPAVAMAQEDEGCDASVEVLNYFKDALLKARDSGGTSISQNTAEYLKDASEYALFKTERAGWPKGSLGALQGTFKLAGEIEARDGALNESDGEALLARADSLAATTTERCGAEVVPAFARPGVGDARACETVIEALDEIERLVPYVMGIGGALGAVMMLPVQMQAQDAAGEAAAAQWTAESVASLTYLASQADGYSHSTIEPNATIGAALVGRLNAVAVEAQSICGRDDIPMLAETAR